MSKKRYNKASKNHSKKLGKKLQDIVSIQDLTYSSIFSISAFFISLVIFILTSFFKENIFYNYIIIAVSLITFFACYGSIRKASKKSKKTNGKNNKAFLIVADIGTNIGYLSPILLLFSAVSSINNDRRYAIFFSLVIVFLFITAVVPVYQKYKKTNSNLKIELENYDGFTNKTKIKPFCQFLIVLFIVFLLVKSCANLHIVSLSFDKSIITPIKRVLYNDYVVNILCTIITAVALYALQIKYSKYKLKQDFRCNEIMSDLYEGIKYAGRIKSEAKKIEFDYYDKTDYHKKMVSKSKKYYEFYVENKNDFYLSHLILTYHNNDILLDSIQSVFFINLNFKLLNIINNIKNRKPNLEKEYPNIESLYEQYNDNQQEEDLMSLGFEIERYINDVGLMGQFCFELLNYLGYDLLKTQIYQKIISTMYPSPDDYIALINMPEKEQKRISREIYKKYTIEYIKNKIAHFFHKKQNN